MKLLILLALLITVPAPVFALQQTFTQQGLMTTIKLAPEKLEPHSKVQLQLSLEREGLSVTDREVTLEVYEHSALQPLLSRKVGLIGTDYLDSWAFDKPGEYKVVIKIADEQKPDQTINYEISATVTDPSAEQADHGFFEHHLGGHWGWWGAGMMVIMMVPMMILL